MPLPRWSRSPGSGAVNVVVEVRRARRSSHGPTTTRYHRPRRRHRGDPGGQPRARAWAGRRRSPSSSTGGSPPVRPRAPSSWCGATAPGWRTIARQRGSPASHGGSIALDGGDSLTTQALRAAIEQSALRRVDVLGCDACLMSMVEIAYELRGVADFLVASETEQPSQSWPYAPLLAALREHPEIIPRRSRPDPRAQLPAPGTATRTNPQRSGVRHADRRRPPGRRWATSSPPSTRWLALLVPRLPLLEQLRPDLATMEIPDYIDLGDFLDQLGQTDAEPEVSSATKRVRQALATVRLDTCQLGPEGDRHPAVCRSTSRPRRNAARFGLPRSRLRRYDTRWPDLLRAFAASRPWVGARPRSSPPGVIRMRTGGSRW